MRKPTDTMLQITKEALFRFQRSGSRKSLLGLVVVIALLGLGFGVAYGTDEPTPPEPLKIGYLADYSGPLAEYGAAIELGVKLAVEQINVAGGVNGQPVTYVTGDTELGSGMATAIATAEARRLIDVEGVHAIVGPLAGTIALAVAEGVARDAQIPVVSPYATSPGLAAANDNGYLFRTTPSNAAQGIVLADNLVEADGVDNVAVLYVNNPYGAGLSGAFEISFDGTVTSVPYKWGATSYLAELRAAAANGAEALVIVGYSESQVILSESIANDLFKTYYFVSGNRSEDLATAVGAQNVEGLRGVTPGARPATDSSLAWNAAYKARYGPFSDAFYGGVREAYDAVVAIALAAEAANSVEGPAIRNQLQSVASPGGLKIIASQASIRQGLRAVAQGTDVDYEGAASSVNWNESGDVTSGYVDIWEFQNGIPITQKTIPFEYPDTGIIPIPVISTVALTLGTPDNGDVSADCSPNCDTLAVGATVTVTAVPDRGYELIEWECTGSCPSDGTATNVSFTVSRDTRITPVFDEIGAMDDHGDNPATATEIGIGSSIEGELAPKGAAYEEDLDYFRVVVSETARLALYTPGGVASVKRLFVSDGVASVSPIAFDDPLGTWINYRITSELVPGTYYIEVGYFRKFEGNYTLYVSEYTEEMDDHGDDPATATEIDIGSSIEGKLALKGGVLLDYDYFRVVVSETALLAFYTTGSINTVGRLYASDGVSRITTNYQRGADDNFRIIRELAPGTYYLAVTPYRNDNGDTDEGDYTLYVSEEAFKIDDHGDNPATATEIGIGSSIEGELALKKGGSQDSDYFRVVVAETATLAFYTTGNTNTDGRLFASDGFSEIAYSGSGGVDDSFRITRELAPGTYYIKVASFRRFDGNYTLYVSEEVSKVDNHGDNPAAATEIGIGSSIEGELVLKIGGAPDLDYFRVVVAETATLAFYTKGSTNTVGRLFASDGVSQITYNYESGADDNFRITRGLVPGTYYIEVASYQSDEGDYTLYVSDVSQYIEEMDDHGDNPATATEICIGSSTEGEPGLESAGIQDLRPLRNPAADTEICIGSSIEGRLGLKSGGILDRDYFRVVVSETAILAFYTKGRRVDTAGRLFASDGVSLIATDNQGGDDDNFRITRELVPGTYYIEVAPFRIFEGNYTLHISKNTIDDYGDNPSAATEIGVGSSIEGELALKSGGFRDSDYFRVVLSEPATLAFYTTGSTNTVGRLFASDGVSLIAAADDGGIYHNFRITSELVPGTYYIEVAPFTSYFERARGDYTLYVSEYPEEIDDHGDNPAAATEIGIGSSIEGELVLKIGGALDLDYFRVVVSDTATLAFYTTGNTNTVGRLLASDGVSQIAIGFDRGADGNFRITSELVPGTYYIEVGIQDEVTFGIPGFSIPSVRFGGDYTLYVSEYPEEMDDHGDNPATATEIGAGSSIEGELVLKNGVFRDSDYFRVVVSEAAILTFYTTRSSDIVGRLFASDGVSRIDYDYQRRANDDFRIVRELAPGTYYLAITPHISDEDDYTLHVSEELFKIDNHGDSPATATEIGIGSSIEGELAKKSEGATDLDYFRVVVSETAILAFYTTGSTDTVGRLFASDGVSLIDGDDDDGIGLNFKFARELVPGTYYVEVRPFRLSNEGSYTLVVADLLNDLLRGRTPTY